MFLIFKTNRSSQRCEDAQLTQLLPGTQRQRREEQSRLQDSWVCNVRVTPVSDT